MTKTFTRRIGVRALAGLALAGLMASTPGLADTPVTETPALATTEIPLTVTKLVPQKIVVPVEPEAEHIGDGHASYYGNELAGNRTANGERFNPQALTAAHRTLPFGTKLRVTNKANGKSVIVRINDRGPFVKKRLIDLSLASARQINMVSAGEAMVRLERLR